MKWICLLFLAFSVQYASSRRLYHLHRRNYATHMSAMESKPKHIQHYQHSNEITVDSDAIPELEIDTLKCPLGCVCQYARFTNLPISRWINHMQNGRHTRRSQETEDSAEDLMNDNEATYETDDTLLSNPFMKQATCILQEDNNPVTLVNSLPHDLQALILLYTGVGKNKTVNTSILKPLNQLTTLEIRGPQDRTFRLVFDEPLSFLQYANFESITLLGSETFKRPKNPVHPSDSFDYKPKSELYESYSNENNSVTLYSNLLYDTKLGFELQQDEVEILPYDIYMLEVKKARMPNFYGWEHLEVLRIHLCQLNELDWEMFDGLDTLQHLSLERNAIEVVPAFALYGAMHIKTLSLAHNHIHDLHYRALAGLLELEVLNLSNNRLGKLSELSFPPFPKLEHVDFRNNPIRYIFPAAFWVMNKTRVMLFNSSEMPLELWGNLPFESLKELKELHIGNVSIKSLEQNTFKGLNSLEKLKLRGEIRSIEFDAFIHLVELQELDLSECHIREVSMDAFMGCKKLKILNLAHNNISYISPGLFDDQKYLQEIYLQDNQLRTLPNTFFLQPKLRLARLSANPWKCNCEMSNWRSKITNQEREPRVERCVSDFHTGRKLACHHIDNFKFDHRHAPRCENFNGRSVFYVLRKQLQCGQGRVVYAKYRKLAQHVIGLRNLGESFEQPKDLQNLQAPIQDTRLLWNTMREEKLRRKWAQKNTIEYVLQQEKRKVAQQKLDQLKTISNTNPADEEVSNEIRI